MPRKSLTAVLLSVLLAAALLLPAAAQPRPDAYILPGDAVFPEGVAFDANTGVFYVSSTNGGAIYRGDLGEELTEIFLPGGDDGRTAATGMKVDDQGRLFVSGGATGKGFVYDTASGDLLFDFTTTRTPTFINDVALAGGSAYFTDSRSPVLYRVFEDGSGWHVEEWLDFTGTAFEYIDGFNANGIAATPDGTHLIIVQSNTGKLFRVEVATKAVIEIDLGDPAPDLTAGDGIVLRGRTLYVVRNAWELIVEVQLTGDLSAGEVVAETTHDSFIFPTTAAIADGRLLVVNSQFNNRRGTPDLPFTVSSVPVP